MGGSDMKRASCCTLVVACLSLAAAGASTPAWSQPASSTASPKLDYEFFKAKVEPVFLAQRPGHARCVVCHTFNNAPFKVVRLSPGSTTWTEEQSRQNFQLVQKGAQPGFEGGKLGVHPLPEEAVGQPLQ